MLHLHCTDRLVKATGIELQLADDISDLNWLDGWYANQLPLKRASGFILFTNAETLYSILVPYARKKLPFRDILEHYKNRLRLQIPNKVYPDRLHQHIFCKTKSRNVLGCMNDMALSVRHIIYIKSQNYVPVSIVQIEEMLNGTPYKALKYRRPVDLFHGLLQREASRLM